MRLSSSTKSVFAMVLIVAALVYLVIIEVAVNAGQVHHGVSVRGFDIGGLNQQEAFEALRRRGDQMEETPMVFTTEGFDCRFTPEQVGWSARPGDTAAAAMEVGRDGSPFEALADRWRAWTTGVSIGWQGNTNPARVTQELDRCEEASEGLGLEIERPMLRFLIKRTIVKWPREPVEIPLLDALAD